MGQHLAPGQIRDANSYILQSLINDLGGEALRLPIAKDDAQAIRDQFQQALNSDADAIVSTAGVSVGTGDLIRMILDERGDVSFWRVNIRPGKPLAFGKIGGIPFFGLPGNPVSAMVTFEVLVRPALAKMMGWTYQPFVIHAKTTEPIQSDGRQTYVRVKLQRKDSHILATPTGTQSSGALMSMVRADGLLIIPAGTETVAAGTQLPVRLLRGNL